MSRKYLSTKDRRSHTIEAVVALAGRHNPANITTSVRAKHMGLTQGALFRHFPSKEAIWQTVMEWVANQLLARIDHAAECAPSPLDALQAIFFSHVDFVIEHPGIPRMMFGELQRAEMTPTKKIVRMLMKNYVKRLTYWLEEAKNAGDVSVGVDTHAAALLLIGTVQGLVMQSLLSGSIRHIRKDAEGAFAIYKQGILR